MVQGWIYAAIIFTIIAIIASIYFMVKGTPYEGHLMEWLNIVVRVMHITFGIAWIGASFYFVFLENALNSTENVRDELAGNLWAVHGGGFYYLEKYKVAPKDHSQTPALVQIRSLFHLGIRFCLVIHHLLFQCIGHADRYQCDEAERSAAIGIGIGSFIVAWLIYDLLCKSPLVKNHCYLH